MAMAGTESGWQEIIADELEDVSGYMHEATRDSSQEIQEAIDYALDSRGKMIRPSMIVLMNYACGGKCEARVLKYGAAAELVHMATLIHDDINDESDYRRGKMTAHKKYGVSKALSIGDTMMIRAIGLFESNPGMIENLTKISSDIASSEFIQYNHKFDLDIMEQEYYQIISGKTAVFLSECARTGATAAGVSKEMQDEMARFGHLYGMAFQIADDLIDLTGTEKVSGKTAMRDLSEGVITLPTIMALRDEKVGGKIRDKIKGGASLDDIRDLIMQTDAIEDCKAVIQDYVDESIECLDKLDESKYKDSLIALARLNSTRIS